MKGQGLEWSAGGGEVGAKRTPSLWQPFSRTADPKRPPVCLQRGEGQHLFGADGRRYLDTISGLFNVPLGYSAGSVKQSIRAQLDSLPAQSLIVGRTEIAEAAATAITSRLKRNDNARTFFSSGGSEAIDTALKMARHYFYSKGRSEKRVVLTFRGGYHGMTYGALSATGNPACKWQFGALLPDIVPAADASDLLRPDGEERILEALRRAISFYGPGNVAGLLLEPVFGIFGAIEIPPALARAIRAECSGHDILLIADEVTCGMWRCGGFARSDALGLAPDIIVMGKGLTNGYVPIGVTIASQAVHSTCSQNETVPFLHGYTFGGNPLACAAIVGAVAEAAALESDRIRLVPAFEAALGELARISPHVGAVRQVGLLACVELAVEGLPADRVERLPALVREAAESRGLIVRAAQRPAAFNFAPMYIADSSSLAPLPGAFAEALDLAFHRLGELATC